VRAVLQRVSGAKVKVDDNVIGNIGAGYVIFLGVAATDDRQTIEKVAEKIKRLRLFPDENGKTNLSIGEIGGEILVISQFTLLADCKKGNRPSFTDAAPPEMANELYEYFIEYSKKLFNKVEHGIFGADMKVTLTNEGPFTIILED